MGLVVVDLISRFVKTELILLKNERNSFFSKLKYLEQKSFGECLLCLNEADV